MPNKITYTIKTADGKEHQVSKENIDKHGIQAYADAYEGATIRMRDSKKGDYDIPLSNYNDAKAQGLHAFSWEHKPVVAQNNPQATQKQPAPKVNTTPGTPMTAAQKAQVLDNTNNLIAQSQSAIGETILKNKVALDRTKKPFSNINNITLGRKNSGSIGSDKVKEHTIDGKKVYSDDKGNIYDSENSAVSEVQERMIDRDGLSKRIAELSVENENANKRLNEIREKYQKQLTPTQIYGQNGTAGNFNALDKLLENDDEYMMLLTTTRNNQRSLDILRNKQQENNDKHNGVNVFGRSIKSLGRGMRDYFKTDFDPMGDATGKDALAYMRAEKIVETLSKKLQTGETLSTKEKATLALFNSYNQQQDISGDDNLSSWMYSGGRGVSLSAEFGAMIASGAGSFQTIAEKTAQGASKAALSQITKYLGKGVAKNIGTKIATKAVGSVAGMMSSGLAYTSTVGFKKTFANAMQNYVGEMGVTEDGQIAFGEYVKDKEGKVSFKRKDGGITDLVTAFAKAGYEQTKENGTEMLGETLPSITKILKGIGGTAKFVSKLEKIGATPFVESINKALRMTGYNGLPSQGIEEYAGLLSDVIFSDASLKDFGKLQTHLDIWGNVALTSGVMSSVQVAGIGTGAAMFYKYKHQNDKAGKKAQALIGDKWNGIQEVLDNTVNAEFSGALAGILSREDLNGEQKKRVVNYANSLLKMRGFNIGFNNDKMGRMASSGEKGIDGAISEVSYAAGYNATEDELANIKNELELRHRQLAETFKDDPSALQQIEEDPKAFLQGLKESEVGGEKAKVINAYEETRAAYDGMIQRVKDNIDDAVTENNTVIEQRTHQDGNIYSATMKLDDRKVYVVGGNVQMNEDGTGIDHEKSSSSVMIRDAETGKIEMVDPSAILSVDTPVNAEEEKVTSSEQIKQTYAQEQANKIDGVLEFKAGDTYSILGEDQKQHTIQIIGEAIDEKTKQPNPDMVMASIDGLEPTMLPKEQIQAMNDEENLWRLDQSLKQGEEVENTTPHSKQSYGYQKKITLTNENGNLVRGEIVSGQNEDGRFEVQTEEPVNGKTVNHLTAEELDAMHAQIQEEQGEQMESPALVAENATTQKEDVSGVNDGTIAENATVQKEETPQHEPTALERIPTNEQGEPIYEQADPETAWDAIVEQTEGDESIAQSVADGMVADMEAAVRRAEKAKVKGGTTIAEKIAAEKERVATIEQAKATLEHWKKIASTNSRRQDKNNIENRESGKIKPYTHNVDMQGNLLDENGELKLEKVNSIDDITDDDFNNPTRNIELPAIPQRINDAIGANGKRVIIKKNIFEKNKKSHRELTPTQSRDIIKEALYNATLYGQNQKETRPYNWILIHNKDKNSSILIEVNNGKNNVEVINWHYLNDNSLERKKRQAIREGGRILTLESAVANTSEDLSSAGKVSESSNAMQENVEKSSENEATRVETNPTEAQKEAGNYKKGHIKVDGMNITIEQPKGSIRRGKDASGKEWESEMHNTYGYIRGTEGVDGDHIDIFLSDNPNEGNVFVVDQVNKDGSFDEHKVMYGFADKESARKAYLSNYEDGWQGLGNITEVSKEEFKKWIGSSKRKTKPFAEYKGIQSIDHSQKEQLKSTQGKEGNEQDFEDKKELEDFVASTDSNNRTKIDESKYDAEDLFAPLLLDGKPSNLAVMTLVSDNINDPVLQIAVYDYSSDIDNKTNSGWQKWGDLADEYNAHVAEEDRTWERNDNAMLGFKTVDAAVKFNDWLKSKEEGKSNVVHSFGNSASQNDTSIKLSDTSFAKMENGEQKAEREIGWLVDHNIRLEENSRKLDEIAHLLFDGDNIDSNRESTLREEAKKILEENEKLSRDYQKNYSDKYFGTDDITANYILQEANERLIALGVKPVKESYYFQNRKNEVAQNAVVHLLKRIGIPVHFITRVGAEASGQENSRGWTNGLDIWLTKDNINAETPVHEYTHIWTFALMKKNPKLWAEIKNLLKDSEWVDAIQSMDEYKYTLDNEDLLYSEVLSHISGERNGEKFESMAFKLIEEVNSVEKKVDLKRGLEKLRDALKRFWEWVGVNLFGMKEFKSVDDVCDRVLFDLLNASDIARTEEMREYYEEEREMNTIIDKAKEDGTYLKTPNGEDTKLPEKVWAYARTKKFKTQLSDRLNLILNESKEDFKDWEKEEFRDLFKKHDLLEENNEPGRFLVSQFMYSEKYYDRKGKMQEEAKETMNSGKGGENVSSVKSVDMRDAEYIKAVENNDTETIQRLLSEEAERKGYSNDSSYQGSLAFNGSAPYQNAYFETKEERKEAWENDDYEDTMSLGDYVDSGIDTNNLEWNLTDPMALRQADPERREAIENLRQTVRSNSKTITIYRAVDANIKENEIRNGDWVTPSRSYAEYHIGLQDWENGRVIEQEVSIDDLWWDGNDIAEWGYDNGKGEVYKNTPNNRKMFEVTYDDKGNIIPLSERFNEDNDDIRYRYEEGEYPFVDLRKDHTSSKDIIKRGRKTGNIYFSRYSPARVRTALIKRLGEMGVKYDVNNAVTTNSSYVNFVANGVKFDVRLATHTKISDAYDNTKALDFKFEDGKINDVALDSSAYGFKTEEILNIIDEVKRFNELGYKPNDDITKVPSNDKQIDWYDYPYIGETLFEKVNESVLRQREGEYRELQLQEERKTKERMKTFMETFYPFTTSDGAQVVIGKLDGKRLVYKDGVRLKRSTNGYALDEALKEADNTIDETRRQFESEEKKQLPFEEWQMQTYGNVVSNVFKVDNEPNSSKDNEAKTFAEEHNLNIADVIAYKQAMEEGHDSVALQVKQPIEQSKNLVALHNLSEEKLQQALELGGFPMPSIAITKANIGHTEFGNISLLFGKDSINPTDKRNKVYGGDAWTPTFPSIGYKLNSEKTSDIYRRANNVGSLPLFRPVFFHPDNYENKIDGQGSNGLVEHFKDDYGAKQMFLYEKGNAVEKFVQHEVEKYSDENVKFFEKILEIIGLEKLKNESYDSLENEMKKLLGQYYDIDFDTMKPFRVINRINSTIQKTIDYAENGNNKIENDIAATEEKIDERIDPKEFRKWLEKLFSGVVEKKGIRNKQDMFTPSGNRREWEKLYDAVTLDNAIKAMQTQAKKGGTGLFGGSIFGAASKELKEIEDIRNEAKLRINPISEEDYQAEKDRITERLKKVTIPSVSKSFSDAMDFVENVQDAVSKSHTAKGIYRHLHSLYPDMTMEVAKEIEDIVKDIQKISTRYLEAKPYRAVSFDEIKAAVVPSDTSSELIQQLKDRGIEVSTYEKDNQEQRKQIVNEVAIKEELLFRNDEELEEANQRFNEELKRYKNGEMNKNEMLHLGSPHGVMRSFLPDLPIVMRPRILNKASSTKHNVDISVLENLPFQVSHPIFVFKRKDNALGVLTEIKDRDGLNVCVAIELNKIIQNGGELLEVNDIRSIHGRSVSNLILPIIHNNTLKYVDKAKALNYLSSASYNYQQEIDNKELSSAANIVKSFENPTNSSEKVLDRKTAQAEEVAEKERQQMAERANELAETLHLDNVEIVTDASTLEGKKAKAKGFYSTSTGKITIVIPNHSNIADVEKTLLHEAVAHHGLRKLFGEHFDNFLDNVFKNASEDVRREIVKLAAKNKWDFRIATEEYLASLAEDTNFEKMPNGFWDKVKRLFSDMLRSIGLKQKDGELNNNELRYILWRSYKNLKEKGKSNSILNKAEDIAMQHRLKVGNYSESTDKEVRFRDGEPQSKERVSAAERYEHRVSRSMFQSQEALQDSMLGLKEAMDAIMRAEGKEMYIEDIEGFENAYLGENRLSSVNQAETEAFAHLVFKPMLDEVAKLAKNDKERSELTDYMMAKHGLERNEVMRKNALEEIINNEKLSDAQKDARASIAEHRDYAGLTALTGASSVEEAESEAQRMVEEYEQKHDTSNLWDKVNIVTKGILSKSYECGMMNKQTYEKVRDMYQFYIPLRGFDEETSREAYAYLSHGQSAFNAPIKTAKGRSSKADDPFANMQSMAESAIMQGNRNVLVKQKFLNFALNHPSDLVSVNTLWLKYDDVSEEWRPVFPDNIEETDTADEVEKKIQDFEQRMTDLAKQDPERYKHGKDTENIPYRIVESRDLRQHQVVVKRNGRDYVLTINGNPRAAQALNGLTNPDNDISGAIGAILNFGEKINRQLSAFYTTRNPDFVVSNFIRDMLYANSIVWVKERPNYALRFHRNIGRCNPAQMKILLSKHKKGKLDMNNSLEHMFHQFIMNGGETGYANVRDIEQHKNDIQRELKRANGKIGIKRSLSLLGEKLDEYNRAVENCARFSAFLTSREMGRTIDRSIYDAKDISVNFNKKGSGAKFMNAVGQTKAGKTAAFVSGFGRSFYLFWNAAIQGTTNFGKQFKRHPAKAFTASATMFILGALVAGMGMGEGDDDDKNSYWNLPESVRRSNILFRTGDQWISIPLPVEYRSIYGMGELMISAMSGKEHFTDAELGKAIAGQVTQILPIDFLEGEGGVKAFVPSAVKPFAEVISNKGWTGMPIYKDTPYNKNMPEWTKTYKSANKYLIGLAKILNEKTGGDAYTKGAVDINPAQIEYLLNGYFGGVSTTIDKLTKSAETIAGKRDYDPKSFLLLNRVLKSGDERTEERAINREYYRLKEEYEILRNRLKNYEHDTDEGIFDFSEKINFLYNSPEYARYEIFEDYREDIEGLYKELKGAMSDDERAYIERELTELKKQMIEEMNATRK
ncbi:LPD38 domain-containing protein [Hoylesella nanceiensis]|uniref:LPD38 domain-containing protein n=1 Tax=Hoylesella nanceiensis TaxID=425941 RepID=UPI00241C7C60|nr:LPD38 domain-containing protein [Hoylesella nanceiensis]